MMFWPRVTAGGPLLLMATSAAAPTFVVVVDWLSAIFGSPSMAEAEAVFTIAPPAYDGGTLYIEVSVTDWPAVSVPITHGNDVQVEPVTERKAIPVGVGSETVTPVAVDGPLFCTTIE